jgi:hypothetical protein
MTTTKAAGTGKMPRAAPSGGRSTTMRSPATPGGLGDLVRPVGAGAPTDSGTAAPTDNETAGSRAGK